MWRSIYQCLESWKAVNIGAMHPQGLSTKYPESLAQDSALDPSKQKQKIKVLLIDDEAFEWEYNKAFFKKFKLYDVGLSLETSYPQGLAAALHSHFDLILVDYCLGAQTGAMLIAEARKQGCQTPMILLTGSDDEQTDHEGAIAGAYELIVKGSLNQRQFERALRYALERKNHEETILSHNHALANFNAQLESQVLARTQELQTAYKNLASFHAKLEKEDELKTRFIANLSHEFRTPLTSLSCFIDLMRNDPAYYQKEFLDLLRQECNRLIDLSKSITDFGSLVENPAVLGHAAVNLTYHIIHGLTELAAAAAAQQLNINTQMPTEAVFVHGNAQSIDKLLYCIFSNAIKFSPPQAEIKVTLEIKPDTIGLSIQNYGNISSTDFSHIFDAYYQGGNQMVAKPSGLGIGLSMAKRLASELNIVLTMENVGSESVCVGLEFNKVPQTA